MANRTGKVETVADFIFLGSKIIAGSNCSHEIKRHLLLGRKAMTNLCYSVAQCVWFFMIPWTAAHQVSYPSLCPRLCSNSCPLSQWCHPIISSSVTCCFSCPQSFPASRSFPMSLLFISGDQIIGVSTSASVLPMNIQDWSPLRWSGWISLQSKALSRVFSNTIVQKHQFFSAQLSLYI